jgi:hypothetical protein
MSAVRPQLGARTSAVAALLVVGGGLLLAYVLICGMFAIWSAHSFMQGPPPKVERVRASPPK